MDFRIDRPIWFQNGYRWENGVLRAVYHATDDFKLIIEDRVGTLHAVDMNNAELFAPSGGTDIILSPERDSDLSINTSFDEALVLFLAIPPGIYHLFQRVRWRVSGNQAVDVMIVGILHLPSHQIVYKVKVIDYPDRMPSGRIDLGLGSVHYVAVPPESAELREIAAFSEGTSYACPCDAEHPSFALPSVLCAHLTSEHGLQIPSADEMINDYVNGLHEVEGV